MCDMCVVSVICDVLGLPPWKEKYHLAVPFTNISSLIATKDKYNEKLVSIFNDVI